VAAAASNSGRTRASGGMSSAYSAAATPQAAGVCAVCRAGMRVRGAAGSGMVEGKEGGKSRRCVPA